MSSRKFWIASYDIKKQRVLSRVSKRLLKCMRRIQKSVYVGHLDDDMIYSIYKDVGRMIEQNDLFLICPICKEDIKGIKVVGKSSFGIKEDIFNIL